MDIISHFAENHYQLLAIAAATLLLIEIAFLGMSTPLLFIGLSCAIVSFFSYIGLVSGWEYEFFAVAVLSIVLTASLWKKIKMLKTAPVQPDESSDLINKVLFTKTEITKHAGSIDYTGVSWTTRIDPACQIEKIEPETEVKITRLDGTTLFVMPV